MNRRHFSSLGAMPIPRRVVQDRDPRAASRPWMSLVWRQRIPSGGSAPAASNERGEPDGDARMDEPDPGVPRREGCDPKTDPVLPDVQREPQIQVRTIDGVRTRVRPTPSSGGFRGMLGASRRGWVGVLVSIAHWVEDRDGAEPTRRGPARKVSTIVRHRPQTSAGGDGFRRRPVPFGAPCVS